MSTVPSTPLTQAKQKSKPPAWRRILATKRNRIILGSVGVVCIGMAISLAWFLLNNQPQTVSNIATSPTPTPTPTNIPKDTPNPLNGVLYTANQAAKFLDKQPIAVMVENHVQARPQSGLQAAEVIYEAMAEGGITRFMALYLANSPDKIGPVRSARLHFVNWAAEYNAAYGHWGGSNEALAYLRSHTQPRDIDQFLYSNAFWRDYSGGKPLEHTGYTSVSKIRSVLSAKNWQQPIDIDSWTFKDDAPTESSQVLSLNFLGTRGYAAQFTYRPETNDYSRVTGGSPHIDASTNTQLTAKTIVLLWQKVTNYTDSNGHPAVTVNNIGSGQAAIIQDGTAQTGLWSKASTNSRTTLTDASGHPLPLNRGKLWVISVPIGSSVTY